MRTEKWMKIMRLDLLYIFSCAIVGIYNIIAINKNIYLNFHWNLNKRNFRH